jgi:hypothetical protein
MPLMLCGIAPFQQIRRILAAVNCLDMLNVLLLRLNKPRPQPAAVQLAPATCELLLLLLLEKHRYHMCRQQPLEQLIQLPASLRTMSLQLVNRAQTLQSMHCQSGMSCSHHPLRYCRRRPVAVMLLALALVHVHATTVDAGARPLTASLSTAEVRSMLHAALLPDCCKQMFVPFIGTTHVEE